MQTSGQFPAQPVWVAGSGPLPLLYMTQLLSLGGRIAGYLDTTPHSNRAAALPHLGGALAGWRDLRKGLGWLAQLRRAGVPIVRSEEHTSELQSLMRNSYAVFCLKKT